MLINCDSIAKRMKDNVKEVIREAEINPTLALVRVLGDDASAVYVRNKVKSCEEVGIRSIVIELPNDIEEHVLIEKIEELNENKDINGILVQLPLPKHINKDVVNIISPIKDVDCLSSYSVGRLFGEEADIVKPCTPKGIMTIIKSVAGDIEGKRVLIINRSMLVGKPLVELIQRENATAFLAHSKTGEETIKSLLAISDIVVTGTGKIGLIDEKTISAYKEFRRELGLPYQIIIDVSINRNEEGKLCGDVSKDLYDREDIIVTPVPKGVGLTTVASLLENVVELAIIQKSMW